MSLLRILAFPVVGAALGALLGYAGKCTSGTCPLTATPWRGALYGATVAALVGFASCSGAQPDRGEAAGEATKSGEAAAETAAATDAAGAAGAAGAPVHVADAEMFGKVTEEGVVLVDFYADWCPPCKKLAPVLRELAAERSGSLTVAKVNVDENRELAGKHGVRGIPHLLLWKDGEVVGQTTGFSGRKALEQWLDSQLKTP